MSENHEMVEPREYRRMKATPIIITHGAAAFLLESWRPFS